MLCVALMIIFLAWAAICIATMTQCIVYDCSPASWNVRDECADDTEESVGESAETSDINRQTSDVVRLEVAVRWCGVVLFMVLLISLSTQYEC